MSADNHSILTIDIGTVKPQKVRKGPSKLRRAFRIGVFPIKLAIILVLPFYLLVRGSVWAYQDLAWGTWPSLLAGIGATLLLFLLYLSAFWKKLTGKWSAPKLLARGAAALVIGYSVYGLMYISAANAKTPEITEQYTALHPMLRLASSTFLLFDRDAVVTDAQRTVEDYMKMGLPVNESSLHFKLEDRFVHALDLRTIGRPEWKNEWTARYFRLMGFRTLRHVGTADHLHVSLPIPEGS